MHPRAHYTLTNAARDLGSAVAYCMRDALRADDVYGRWGGEEFLVALPATDEEHAHIAAERIRHLADSVQPGDIGLANGIRCSIGVSTAIESTPLELVRAADVALYEAKSTRRATAALHDGDGATRSAVGPR
jgi:diguanylate cyclase (GGDEF)-like protein